MNVTGDDDYDSEADSDYDPTKDVEAGDAEASDQEDERGLSRISTKRKYEIESVFDSMREEEETALRKKMSLSFRAPPPPPLPVAGPRKSEAKREKKLKKRRNDVMSALSSIFGSTTASTLMHLNTPHLVSPDSVDASS